MRIILLLGAALVLAAAALAPVPEPSGLWQGPMHGATPAKLAGATVIDTATLAKLRERLHPLLLDAADMPKKPPEMAKDMPWMPTHRTVPGAIWLVGAGNGTSAPAFAAAFKTRIAALTGNDLAKPIIVFCHPHCWASWNAGKRLIGLGYRHVYWYPDGAEGWESGHETQVATPDPIWDKALAPS
jgi:PQQ-dependent catabolism-associated CXXCW motif protein